MKNSHNQIFLQARLCSQRLPGKVLMKLEKMSVLEFLVERLKKIKNIEKIVLVTGSYHKNKLLITEAERLNLEFFCGNENNLLDRMYQASKKFNPDNIIRITGDCPLIDPKLISDGLEIFLEKEIDILSNARKRTFPDGFDFEIFRKNILLKSWESLKKESGNEKFLSKDISPTKFLLENKKFRHYDFLNNENLAKIRLTLDYPEDYQVISKIVQKLYPKNKFFSLCDIINFIDVNPNLLKINEQFVKTDYGLKLD